MTHRLATRLPLLSARLTVSTLTGLRRRSFRVLVASTAVFTSPFKSETAARRSSRGVSFGFGPFFGCGVSPGKVFRMIPTVDLLTPTASATCLTDLPSRSRSLIVFRIESAMGFVMSWISGYISRWQRLFAIRFTELVVGEY